MSRSDWIRFFSWFVPTLCVVLAVGLVLWQFQKMRVVDAERAETEKQIASLKESVNMASSTAPRDRIPSVQDSRLEEAMFLDGARQLAAQHKVRLEKWRNEPEAPQANPNVNTPDGGKPASVKKVRTLVSVVEVAGSYEGVRGFVDSMLQGQRLLTIKSGSWTRLPNGETKFSFKLNRFVTNPEPGGPVGMTAGSAIEPSRAI